jgi:hypothetical protein
LVSEKTLIAVTLLLLVAILHMATVIGDRHELDTSYSRLLVKMERCEALKKAPCELVAQ